MTGRSLTTGVSSCWPSFFHALCDRSTGRAKCYVVVRVVVATVAEILSANVSCETHLMSDKTRVYQTLGWNFADPAS